MSASKPEYILYRYGRRNNGSKWHCAPCNGENSRSWLYGSYPGARIARVCKKTGVLTAEGDTMNSQTILPADWDAHHIQEQAWRIADVVRRATPEQLRAISDLICHKLEIPTPPAPQPSVTTAT